MHHKGHKGNEVIGKLTYLLCDLCALCGEIQDAGGV